MIVRYLRPRTAEGAPAPFMVERTRVPLEGGTVYLDGTPFTVLHVLDYPQEDRVDVVLRGPR